MAGIRLASAADTDKGLQADPIFGFLSRIRLAYPLDVAVHFCLQLVWLPHLERSSVGASQCHINSLEQDDRYCCGQTAAGASPRRPFPAGRTGDTNLGSRSRASGRRRTSARGFERPDSPHSAAHGGRVRSLTPQLPDIFDGSSDRRLRLAARRLRLRERRERVLPPRREPPSPQRFRGRSSETPHSLDVENAPPRSRPQALSSSYSSVRAHTPPRRPRRSANGRERTLGVRRT